MAKTDTVVSDPASTDGTDGTASVSSGTDETYASLDQADAITQTLVTTHNAAADVLNKIATFNSSRTKGVDEIIADLRESSTSARVVALRNKRDEIDEEIAKELTAEAHKVKDQAGEPDLDAETNAKKRVKGLKDALATMPDADKVQNFLTKLVASNVGRSPNTGASNSGPKNDLTELRAWAKSNGYEVGDRGRIKPEIVEAYNKATK